MIQETYEVLLDIKNRTDYQFMVFLSKEGETVMKWYRMWDSIQRDFPNFKTDAGPNSPFIAGPLQLGHYDALLIAPATANTVAKIVHGIADTLVTNTVAQTAKGDTPIYILPVDREKGYVVTYSPQGKKMNLKMRDVDVENTAILDKMENITVLNSPDEIYEVLGVKS